MWKLQKKMGIRENASDPASLRRTSTGGGGGFKYLGGLHRVGTGDAFVRIPP
jgi:hypothetical protein